MSEPLKARIKKLAKDYSQDVVAIRRHLHANPELSFQEFETSKFIKKKLTEYGIPFREIAGTGVLAIIEGNDPTRKIIALRADIDALPIVETNEVSYKSKNEGVMHACGHDVHTSSLLGVSKILQELKGHFSGSVKTIISAGRRKDAGRRVLDD